MAKKEIKVGVQQGGGPAPGYEWNIFIIDAAYREATDRFNKSQYRHLSLQMQEVAREQHPSHSQTASIVPVEDFYELREYGGVLGNLNARVFFGVDKKSRAIVILGAIHKQNNGPTPLGDKIRMRRRWRKYLNGDYGQVI